MATASGYFTIERSITGLSPREMASVLGMPDARMMAGARVLLLRRQPLVGEFVYAASTKRPDGEGLVNVSLRSNFPIPHAWLGQRLIKVAPLVSHAEGLTYPKAASPVEQWRLVVPIEVEELCTLRADQRYWPPRRH